MADTRKLTMVFTLDRSIYHNYYTRCFSLSLIYNFIVH